MLQRWSYVIVLIGSICVTLLTLGQNQSAGVSIVARLPQPTGKFPVGTRQLEWLDDSRTNTVLWRDSGRYRVRIKPFLGSSATTYPKARTSGCPDRPPGGRRAKGRHVAMLQFLF